MDRGAAASVRMKAVLLDADGVIQDAIVDQPSAILRLFGTTDRLPEFTNDFFVRGIRHSLERQA